MSGKLTAEQVRAIRLSPETGVELARRYGVSRNQISQIRRRLAWADLPEQPGERAAGRAAYLAAEESRRRPSRPRADRPLSVEQVIEIRTSTHPASYWADKLGIGLSTVAHVRQRSTYADIPVAEGEQEAAELRQYWHRYTTIEGAT